MDTADATSVSRAGDHARLQQLRENAVALVSRLNGDAALTNQLLEAIDVIFDAARGRGDLFVSAMDTIDVAHEALQLGLSDLAERALKGALEKYRERQRPAAAARPTLRVVN